MSVTVASMRSNAMSQIKVLWHNVGEGVAPRRAGTPPAMSHNVDHFVIARVPETAANVLRPHGFLNGSTYLRLRNAIISAAIDKPGGVIIDLNSLAVAESSALSVFT